jgi:hypothetical protein
MSGVAVAEAAAGAPKEPKAKTQKPKEPKEPKAAKAATEVGATAPVKKSAKKTAPAPGVTTLKAWVQGWPSAKELSFDPESREPTVFTKDSARAKVGSIPWRREGDVLTILTQSGKYSAAVVEAATRRYATTRGQESDEAMEAEGERIAKEEAILDAWRAYRAASAAAKPTIMADIMTAERELYKLDESVAGVGRKFIASEYGFAMAFYPPIAVDQRAIALSAVGAAGE